jgi:hypothetical protein
LKNGVAVVKVEVEVVVEVVTSRICIHSSSSKRKIEKIVVVEVSECIWTTLRSNGRTGILAMVISWKAQGPGAQFAFFVLGAIWASAGTQDFFLPAGTSA